MSVVNVKVAHLRPAYENLKEWMADSANNEYVGRAGVVFVDGVRFPPRASEFANPFKIGKDGTREEVLEKYSVYMKERLGKQPALLEKLVGLRGKRLGCWCAPEPCHANILLVLIEENQ